MKNILKRIAIGLGAIVSMISIIYFYIADNIALKIFPFMTNEWHLKQSENQKRWVWIITGYRIVTLGLIILFYHLIKYLLHAIF